MEKICPSFSKKDLDKFLKKRYGVGYLEFSDSLQLVHSYYLSQENKSAEKYLEEIINKIEVLKEKILVLIDLFLIEIDFYSSSKNPRISGEKSHIWSFENKKDFILKNFELKSFYTVMDKLIKLMETSPFPPHPLSKDVKRKIFLKPANLLILVWSFAMKKRKS